MNRLQKVGAGIGIAFGIIIALAVLGYAVSGGNSSTGVNSSTDSKDTADSNIQKEPPIQEPVSQPSPECTGTASCLTGIVTKVVDGDTLDINGTRIRLALVNTPELGQNGYVQAKQFATSLCAVGSTATADEDDGQTAGSFGRTIAKVTCKENKVLNSELLVAGMAVIDTRFCGKSEFTGENWAKINGCE